ncbi:MAG: hypothetical protein ACWA6X_09920 [Bauldia sp.]
MKRLLPIERVTRLGRLGEVLAAEALARAGFEEIDDLNLTRVNYPFADLIAKKDGNRFLIGVKTRNLMRQGGSGLNGSYNLVLISDSTNKELKKNNKTQDQITSMLLNEVNEMAAAMKAEAAWITVSVRPEIGDHCAFFGTVASLGQRRSVPMTPAAISKYLCLANNRPDGRITADLLND